MIKVTDRVPTYAGRVQLIPVDEANGIYDMVRADEPTVVGTPLNAALFESITADLANIAPPISAVVESVANSKNVAFYSSIGAIGLESDASITTDSFLTSVLPLNSAVFCAVSESDTVTISDLPDTTGILLLMKGNTSDNKSGVFYSGSDMKVFVEGAWVGLVTLTNAVLSVNGLKPDETGNVTLESADEVSY